jgi:hypothetical protein
MVKIKIKLFIVDVRERFLSEEAHWKRGGRFSLPPLSGRRCPVFLLDPALLSAYTFF